MPEALSLIGFGPSGWGRPLLIATGMTLALSAAGFALSLNIGLLLAVARLSKSRPLAALSRLYTTVVRGVPELLVLYLLFFGGSALIGALAKALVGAGFLAAPAFLTGALALGLISASFTAEVLRGAWLALDGGQADAAAALGMRWSVGVRTVLLPQVMRLALPGLGNVWQLTLKESALVSLTGLTELMRQSAVASNATDRPFTFYGVAALLYLAITAAAAVLFRRAERRSRRGLIPR